MSDNNGSNPPPNDNDVLHTMVGIPAEALSNQTANQAASQTQASISKPKTEAAAINVLGYLWREWVRPIGEAVLIALVITTFFFASVWIQGTSDTPTILNGEGVFVPKYETWLARLGIMSFKRGDLVVLKPPKESPNSDRPLPVIGNFIPSAKYRPFFIKRIVGVPGDTLRMEKGQLYINGIKVLETHTVPFWKARDSYDDSSYLANSETWPFRKDTGTNKKDYKLGKNQYFVMGDNRSPGGSEDSRVFGPVPLTSLAGRATFVWWPPFAKVVATKVGANTYYRPIDTDYQNKAKEDGPVLPRWRTLPRPEAFVKLNAQLAAQKK